MTTLVSDLVTQAKRITLGAQREVQNKLSAAITSTSQTTISYTYDTNAIRAGVTLEVGTELMYVWDSNNSAMTATVERGYGGTTAATSANSALITVNPRITKQQIIDEMNYELLDLSSTMNRLFKVVPVEFTYQGGTNGYNLTGATDVIDILEVRYRSPGDRTEWKLVRDWQLSRNQATADFASGIALMLRDSLPSGYTVRVVYSTGFAALSSLSQNVASISGLPATAVDILYLGAALRVLSVREIPRNWTGAQPDPRRSDEVPAGAVLNSTRDLRNLRDRRIREESARLLTAYPYRAKGWYI